MMGGTNEISNSSGQLRGISDGFGGIVYDGVGVSSEMVSILVPKRRHIVERHYFDLVKSVRRVLNC